MPPVNAVIDLSHHNQNLDFQQIREEGGIVGAIHKATQGLRFQDPTYLTHRPSALSNGLLWGAYHFGTGSDGVEQAQAFLDFVSPDEQTLLVLDFEANPHGPSMTLEEARAFVTHVQSITGRWPGLYSGYYIKTLLGTTQDPVLANCWFWLAQYGPTPIVPVNWRIWTMWQYTDGAAGPDSHDITGAGLCDRDQFAGDEAALRAFWGSAVQSSAA
jgi:lysozyme